MVVFMIVGAIFGIIVSKQLFAGALMGAILGYGIGKWFSDTF